MKSNVMFWVVLNFSPANAYNLDNAKNVSSGKWSIEMFGE